MPRAPGITSRPMLLFQRPIQHDGLTPLSLSSPFLISCPVAFLDSRIGMSFCNPYPSTRLA